MHKLQIFVFFYFFVTLSFKFVSFQYILESHSPFDTLTYVALNAVNMCCIMLFGPENSTPLIGGVWKS